MPTVEQMAQGYMEQIGLKITDLEKQLDLLRTHLQECKDETKETEDD